MTILEATIEIVKAAIASSDKPASHLIVHAESRENFLTGIEAVYQKLNKLEEERMAEKKGK